MGMCLHCLLVTWSAKVHLNTRCINWIYLLNLLKICVNFNLILLHWNVKIKNGYYFFEGTFFSPCVVSYYGDILVGLELAKCWPNVLLLCRWSVFWMCYTLYWGVLHLHVSRLWRFFWSEGWSSSTVFFLKPTMETRLMREFSGSE